MNNSTIFIKRTMYGLGLFAVVVLYSCSSYYKPIVPNTNTVDNTKNIINSGMVSKYFIIRQGPNSYALNNISVDNAALTLNGNLAVVPEKHLTYITSRGNGYRYKKATDAEVLNEVHIYLKSTATINLTKAFAIPLDQIEKIEVIEHDSARTTTSYIIGGIGITLGVVVVATVIVALTKSSCPFVSVYDGKQYAVQGELFGGAVNQKLERSDYLPLNMRPVNGEYQLRISNELKERQFTNYANLIIIEHNSKREVGIGTDGHVYQLSHPVLPDEASLNGRRNILNTISKSDNLSCNFDDTLSSSSLNEITLTFKNPGNVKKGKIILQLKNSYWFDYLYGEFTRNFGSKYESWKTKQMSKPVKEMIKWTRDQQIPLSIALSTSNGWQEAEKLNTIGPLTNRKVVIPLELNVLPNEPIRIKLSTGFMFWELDYAAMDFSEEEQVTTTTISPYYAMDEKGNDVLNELTANDEKYLTQLETGNFATIKYKFSKPVSPGKTFSVVLDTKGYYEPIRQYEGKANIAFLKKFRKLGALSDFSKEKYQSIIKNQSIIALNSK